MKKLHRQLLLLFLGAALISFMIMALYLRTSATTKPRGIGGYKVGQCYPRFGKVTVFVAYNGSDADVESNYGVAQRSLRCYLKKENYPLLFVNLDKDTLVQSKCGKHKEIYFKKHCAARAFLSQTDWMLVLDADTGVINPNHCVEEWIDNRVNLILYERFFNWEIAAGNYLVRNSEFGMKFLDEWANSEFSLPDSWHGYDQGPLMCDCEGLLAQFLLLLKLLIPESTLEYKACERYWKNASSYATYMAMVYCVRQALGVTKTWPAKVHIFRKFHAFVRDEWATNGQWCKADFMLHGWKKAKLNETPFEEDLDLSLCSQGMKAWKWRKDKKVSVERLRICYEYFQVFSSELKESEDFYRNYFAKEAQVHPFLDDFRINSCYPHCDNTNK